MIVDLTGGTDWQREVRRLVTNDADADAAARRLRDARALDEVLTLATASVGPLRRAGASRARCRRPVRARALGRCRGRSCSASRAERDPTPGSRRASTRRYASPPRCAPIRSTGSTRPPALGATARRERTRVSGLRRRRSRSSTGTVAICSSPACRRSSPSTTRIRRSSAWSSTTARATAHSSGSRAVAGGQVVAHADNQGFAAGANAAAAAATGEVVAFLNNDCRWRRRGCAR